jgi:hypothetical protein
LFQRSLRTFKISILKMALHDLVKHVCVRNPMTHGPFEKLARDIRPTRAPNSRRHLAQTLREMRAISRVALNHSEVVTSLSHNDLHGTLFPRVLQ